MTSVLPKEDTKIVKMKQKLMNDVHGKEENRSFLSFSRENLSISHSEMEKDFSKCRLRPTRNTILSVTALLIALICLGFESWNFHRSVIHAREIEELKKSVENLKHRFLEKDLLDEVKAFEEQLYTEGSNDDDDDPNEADIDNADYDSNYDEDSLLSHDYSSDYHTVPTFGARPSDFPNSSFPVAPVPSPPKPSSDKIMMKLLAAVRKFDVKQDLTNPRDDHRKVIRDHQENRLKKALKKKSLEQKANDTKDRIAIIGRESVNHLQEDWTAVLKRKRSIEEERVSKKLIIDQNDASNFRRSSENETTDSNMQQTTLIASSSRRHPPKKYYTQSSGNGLFSTSRNNSSFQSVANQPKRSSRRLRKNLHSPRQIFAVHYGGNKHGFTEMDEHTGNGRIRHADRVFKAWKPSDWVKDLGMNEYFKMANNGSVTVYKSGLYLVYAQIHYKDEHDEVGFHLEVNNEPILQCVIDNSGNTHRNSQSCFSAQLTLFNKGDILILKEISSSRFALFDKEKSFFGLVKLGEIHSPIRSS